MCDQTVTMIPQIKGRNSKAPRGHVTRTYRTVVRPPNCHRKRSTQVEVEAWNALFAPKGNIAGHRDQLFPWSGAVRPDAPAIRARPRISAPSDEPQHRFGPRDEPCRGGDAQMGADHPQCRHQCRIATALAAACGLCRSSLAAIFNVSISACAAGESERPRRVMIPIRRFMTGP